MPRLSRDFRNLSSKFIDNSAYSSQKQRLSFKRQYFPNGASVKTKHRTITKFTSFSWILKELEQSINSPGPLIGRRIHQRPPCRIWYQNKGKNSRNKNFLGRRLKYGTRFCQKGLNPRWPPSFQFFLNNSETINISRNM